MRPVYLRQARGGLGLRATKCALYLFDRDAAGDNKPKRWLALLDDCILMFDGLDYAWTFIRVVISNECEYSRHDMRNQLVHIRRVFYQ